MAKTKGANSKQIIKKLKEYFEKKDVADTQRGNKNTK